MESITDFEITPFVVLWLAFTVATGHEETLTTIPAYDIGSTVWLSVLLLLKWLLNQKLWTEATQV